MALFVLSPFESRAKTLRFLPRRDQHLNWLDLSFSGLKKNSVSFQLDGLHLKVNGSSSPLFLVLPHALTVSRIALTGKILSGQLKLPQPLTQGAKGNDDFLMKLGLVKPGQQRLSALQKLIAPQWISQLEKSLPKKYGVDSITFLSLVDSQVLLNQERVPPLDEKIRDFYVAHLQPDRSFTIQRRYPKPISVIAFWVQSDGDDTHSIFEILIDQFEIDPVDGRPQGEKK